MIEIVCHGNMIMYFHCSISFTVNLSFTLGWNEFTNDGTFQWTPGCGRYIITTCSLKPYNIKGKSYTINAVDRTAVLLYTSYDNADN